MPINTLYYIYLNMKNYLITERQERLLKEMMIPSGKYKTNPLDSLFALFDSSVWTTDFMVSEKDIVKTTRKYLKNVIGLDTSKITDEDMYQYVFRLRYNEKIKGIPKSFYNIGVISGLSYYLSKSFFKFKKSQYGLSYFTISKDGFIDFFFFDSEIKDFVGRIQVQDNEDFTSTSYTVVVSSADPAFIGRGYGSKMYLTILDKCEYLKSDSLLYKDSLNIWVNVLPKYVNVWASTNNGFVPIKKNFVDPENVKYFVASKKHSTI